MALHQLDISDQQSASVADFLVILQEHKKNCEAAGNYIEADIAKKRLEELHAHEESRKEESLRSRQVAQRLGVEEAHMLEFQQFNGMWDRTMREYEDRASELLEAMRQRHELALQELRAKMTEAGKRVRHSPKLLDLRRIEQTLAKRGEYAEAHRVKLQADDIEAQEHEAALTQREAQLAKAENALLERQDQEVNALRQRIQTGAEEQRVARQQDLERLLRRYHNIKSELETQHNAELLRQKKGLASLPGALGNSRARGGANGASGALSCNSSRAALGGGQSGASSARGVGRASSAGGGRQPGLLGGSASSSGGGSSSRAARPGSASARGSSKPFERPIWR